MRNKKKVVRTSEWEEIESIICDICKKKYTEGWNKDSSYDILETEVSITEGTQFPECGSKTTTFFDICPDCFRNVIVKYIESFDTVPATEESDW